jgi:hypothetical protein
VWHIKKLIEQLGYYTGAPCTGDNKRQLENVQFVHTIMPQVSEGAGNWRIALFVLHVWLRNRPEIAVTTPKKIPN